MGRVRPAFRHAVKLWGMVTRCLLLLGIAFSALSAQQHFDLLIRNARIVDGSGNPWIQGDVAVRGGRIVSMGRLAGARGSRTIDAAGGMLAPGFIDIHNHSRRAILDVPDSQNFIRQGVTTVVEGNDGNSPVPLEPFFKKVVAAKPALNYASFIGHGSIRREVIGDDDRGATPEEITAMRRLVEQGMQQGAFGLSSGLFYVPGAFAPTEEVIELARVAARHGGMYISHMRNEADGLLDSVAETIRIGEEGGLPTQLTHHKAVGPPNWGKVNQTLAMVDAARERGVDATIDQYPYTASHTGTSALFPKWIQAGGRTQLLERLDDPETRRKARNEIAEIIRVDRGGGDPQNVQFSSCEFDRSLDGKTLADATRARGRAVTFENAAETAIEIQIAGGCRAVYHAMQEDDVVAVMRHPATMVASDGGVTPFGEGVPHPRYYGTFPRVLGRYVRERPVLRLEDAVRKMTSLPAQRLGLFARGLIRPGMAADLVLFDPEKVIDRAAFGDSHHYAEGVSHVIVNGVVVLDAGEMTGNRPGQVLRGPAFER